MCEKFLGWRLREALGLKLGLIGFVLGLFWVCIGFDWLCIGFDWVRFGFVFIGIVHSSLFVVHCFKSSYVHFGLSEIGFVLHKKG